VAWCSRNTGSPLRLLPAVHNLSPFRLGGLIWWLTVGCILLFFSRALGAEQPKETKPKPAKLKISGYGLLGNRELLRTLRTLELAGQKPPFFGPDFIEDAALILTSRVKHDGYLQPAITIRLRLDEGSELQVQAGDLLESPLPRPLRITQAHFKIHKGVLYYFQNLGFEGLEAISEKQARGYFLETDTLLNLKRARIYTPERLQLGISSLTEVLDRQGYGQARIEPTQLHLDDKTGAADVRLKIERGPKFMVYSVRKQFFYEGTVNPEEERTTFPDYPYSRLWVQDFTVSIKTNLYHRGYPDAQVNLQTVRQQTNDNGIQLELLATVKSGPQIRIAEVSFQGQKRTRKGLLKRRVRVERGELLDPIRVEQGRYRLARLGIFDTVAFDYQPVDEQQREVIYRLQEGKQLNLSLLFGYGSYELLRGGVQAEANNLWGMAHHADLKVVQSFKASSGDFTYTMPEMVGKDVDVFLNGTALRREEISFTRLEYGGGVGVHKYFQSAATDATLRYNYQILNTLDLTTAPAVASEGLTNPAVGSIVFDLKHDRRDNPLFPRRGYKVFLTVETATEYLGGVANYERVQFAPSWHHPLGGGRYLSLGLSQGVDVSFGSPANNLPFNKRFFPGGANSIRGYQEGEASPRDQFNQLVGAETYTLGTVELEQALTAKWSLVLFSDSLGFAEHINHYPFDTGLYSVGGGLRWRTLIGPIRLEYGYNLNPRPGDPSGTLQFSLGFPF
jgi:outer membrane protein assembly complex protein YaeT